MSGEFERYNVVFIQQGSSNILRVVNEKKWYVIREEWQGEKILNSVILSSHDTEQAAETARDIYKAAVALGRKGGLATSDAKTKANRAKANNPPKEGKLPRGRQLGSKNKPKDKGAN
jgi:hypothetical protein